MNKTGRIKGVKQIKQVYYIPDIGKRLLEVLYEKGITITDMSRGTGIARTTIYEFLYNGRDTTCMRLAKMCRYCGVSTDYILGLKEN